MRVGGDAPADPGRACGRCRAELGRIINRGAVCRSASTTMPMAKVVVVHYLVKNQLYKGAEMEVVVMNSSSQLVEGLSWLFQNFLYHQSLSG